MVMAQNEFATEQMDEKSLRLLFFQVSSLVKRKPSGSDENNDETASDEEKLRLYGLYKRVNDGEILPSSPPPIFQPVARSKFFAWKECSSMSTRDAMDEYIGIISSRRDQLGEECRQLRIESYEKYAASRGESSSPIREERDKDYREEKKMHCQRNIFTAESKLSSDRDLLSKKEYSISDAAAKWMGVRPLVPRGRLDISYRDLAFCLFHGMMQKDTNQNYKRLHNKISRLWTTTTTAPAIQGNENNGMADSASKTIVGLSVRSLFDLYLTMKGYPNGSEILVVPPISVPGMMYVARYHNLRIVPVDIVINQGKKDGRNDVSQWINIEDLKSKVTRKTVAIMVVHPFGIVTTDATTMESLRCVADDHNLEIWEDCAETFTGLGHENYLGCSKHADVRFFSFGTIKTATALGGGIALLKDLDSARHMWRIQQNLYSKRQTRREFFRKAITAILLNFIADSPMRVGMLSMVCGIFGLSLDSMITYSIRGFTLPNATEASSRSKNQKEGKDGSTDRMQSYIRQIRKQPSCALLALLHLRLEQSRRMAPSISSRFRRCKTMASMLEEELPGVLLPNFSNSINTFWAFPICSNDRDSLSRHMQSVGFDVATGASQLCSVSKFIEIDGDERKRERLCPSTDKLMSSILYLPICSQNLPDSKLLELLGHLGDAMNTEGKAPIQAESSYQKQRIFLASIVVILIMAAGSSTEHMLLSSIFRYSFTLILSTILLRLCWEHFLRWTTSDFYLKESSAFAEHCDMIDATYEDKKGGQDGAKKTLPIATGETIMNQMDCLKLPVHSKDEVMPKRRVILTGATGFVGTALLRDLLLKRETISLERVIVICRRKGTASAKSRLERLMSKPIFDFLTRDEKASLIEVVEGDVTKKSAGLCPMDLARIVQDETISHVIHCAAAVSFTMEFPNAAESNITSSLYMQTLTGELKNKDAQLVHISTAFVHGGNTGSEKNPLPEDLFDFQSYNPNEIYRSMVGTQYYASKAMSDLGFPNTYSFSKSVCEHLLYQNRHVNTIIIRPSIVGPAIEAPYEGWAGDRPSTIVAGPCLHLSNQWNVWHLGRKYAACFPVDLLARFIVAKSFNDYSYPKDNSNDTASSSDGSFERISNVSDESSDYEDIGSNITSPQVVDSQFSIFNAMWDSKSAEKALFSWVEFSTAYLHLGSVLGYFSRSNAMMQLLISAQLIPSCKLTVDTLHTLQSLLIRSPFELFSACYDYLGISNVNLKKLMTFLDLPLLFYPFVKDNFHFQSELEAPHSFDAKRYSFSCGVAAHRFILSQKNAQANAENRSEATRKMSCFAVGGRNYSPGSSYLWWALCQPRGDIFFRFVAAFVACVLQRISTIVTVDLSSFRKHLAVIRSKSENGPVHVVLVPTHRSFLDFILLSYVFFSVPELQIDLPFIVAADEFQFLPVIGWLARRLRAFYIQRGKGKIDADLSPRLESLKKENGATTFEVFVEGKRSRDRRFVDPKTGLLKSLKNSGGEHVIVPITINYECIPEQHILSEEAGGSSRRGLTVEGMIFWLRNVFRGDVEIGKVHIVASDPLPLDCKNDKDFRRLVNDIQVCQKEKLVISDYHIRAASKILNVNKKEMESALRKLGCRFWPTTNVPGIPDLPTDPATLLTIMLHFGHILAPLFYETRRKWSLWLSRVCDTTKGQGSKTFHVDIQPLYDQLEVYFDSADALVKDAIVRLEGSGFMEPDRYHIFQTAQAMVTTDLPVPILRAAVLMKFPKTSNEQSTQFAPMSLGATDANLCDGTEKLGLWGFHDSGFIAKIDDRGKHYVTMKGTRYALCGKRMTRLLPFIESSLKVKIDLSKEFTTIHPRWYADVASDLTDIEKTVLCGVVQGQLSYSTFDRLRHGTGHSQEDIFALRNGEDFRIPDAVVWPSSEEEVKAVVHAAREKGWCLIPFGGGTNVIEATRCPSKLIEPRPIISVSMKHLNRILWLNEEDGLACVQAGITGRELVEILGKRGYTMGHEPDSIEFSTLGGWIATKASGMKRSKYGNIEDIVVSARVVSPQGVLWKGSNDEKIVSGRHAEGVDVQTLAFGSEGCLGIITNAVIRIWPLPEAREYGSVLFPRFEDGLQFLKLLSREPHMMPACIRLLDNAHFRLGQALRPQERSWLHGVKESVTKALVSMYLSKDFDPDSVVCATISYEGSNRQVREQMATVSKLSRRYGGVMLGSRLGKSGYDLTYMIAYLRDFAMTYHVLGESFEAFVPWSRIEGVITATKKRILSEHALRLLPGVPFVGCRVTQLYHEGVCLYFYMCISFDGLGDRSSKIYADLERAARDEILKQGGSLSHHHGVGKVRASFAKKRASPEFLNVISSIKDGMDGDNVFGARNGLFDMDNNN